MKKKFFLTILLAILAAVDVDTGKLLWQVPTQDSSIYESAFQLKTSDLIVSNKSILFSNNKNEFFSIDIDTGTLIWKQKINSSSETNCN